MNGLVVLPALMDTRWQTGSSLKACLQVTWEILSVPGVMVLALHPSPDTVLHQYTGPYCIQGTYTHTYTQCPFSVAQPLLSSITALNNFKGFRKFRFLKIINIIFYDKITIIVIILVCGKMWKNIKQNSPSPPWAPNSAVWRYPFLFLLEISYVYSKVYIIFFFFLPKWNYTNSTAVCFFFTSSPCFF